MVLKKKNAHTHTVESRTKACLTYQRNEPNEAKRKAENVVNS